VVTVLLIAVVLLVIALWRMDQRVATLEGKAGNALERVRDAWFLSLSPRGKMLFVYTMFCGMALGVTLVLGLMCASVPFLLYLYGKVALQWPIIFFVGSMILYILIIIAYGIYCRLRGIEPQPSIQSFFRPEDARQ
jgi:hypothetical protein